MEFVPPTKRYRLFFDETGNGDLNAAERSPNERYLSLTGVVIRQDHHDNYVTRRLNFLKTSIFEASKENPLVLHRREIVRREDRFGVLKNERIAREFDARLAAIVAECVTCAFTASIDKLEHKRKYVRWQYSPYHYVMECLVERFVKWLTKNNFVGDVVGEARSPTHDKHLRRAYRRLFQKGNTYQSAEQFQARLTTGELKLVPKNADIAGLQIADILAHPAHRALKFDHLKETPPQDFGSQLSDILRRSIYDRDANGKIAGFGTKWLP